SRRDGPDRPRPRQAHLHRRRAAARVLKEERQQRIVDLVESEGRVVATRLQEVLGVSGYTIRRDLDELAQARRLGRVPGGALSTPPTTYEERQTYALEGKIATANAAAKILSGGETIILDGGSTALQLAHHIRSGTVITHAPAVAIALPHTVETIL